MDCPPGAAEASARGNFVAIGTMLPAIEIWDLDLVEPAAVLGDMMAAASQPSKASKKKTKGKSGAAPAAEAETPTEEADTHTGAVMALAWNGASLL